MSTYDAYTIPVEPGTWDVPAAGATRFSWEYDDGRQRLLDLYQRGKDKQWDATKRIEWDLPVDPTNIMETPDEFVPIDRIVQCAQVYALAAAELLAKPSDLQEQLAPVHPVEDQPVHR